MLEDPDTQCGSIAYPALTVSAGYIKAGSPPMSTHTLCLSSGSARVHCSFCKALTLHGFLAGQGFKLKRLYAEHQPIAPVSDGTMPSQPQTPTAIVAARPISIRPPTVRAMQSILATLVFIAESSKQQNTGIPGGNGRPPYNFSGMISVNLCTN